MQYVNDDMDDLFRRAAENYPLDTNSADWSKVLTALQGQTDVKTISEKKKNKNGRFLWLLLLLPFGFICNQLYNPGALNNKEILSSDLAKENSYSEKSSLKQRNSEPKENSGSSIGSMTTTGTPVTLIENKNSVDPLAEAIGSSSLSKNNRLKGAVGADYSNSKNISFSSELYDPDVKVNAQITEEASSFRNYISEISYRKLQREQPSVVPTRSLSPLFNVSSEDSKQNILVTKRKKFYAGIGGGIDATTVKFQKIENAGYSYGILIGYQFNRKWSIESGAFLERKYYYSDAKYFNTSKIYMPPGSWIDDLSGNCKMIEVPLLAKYNFAGRKQSNWFSALGLSSYFMTQENYTYNYYYGTSGPVPHKKQYNNSSTHLFSNISISGGYAHRLGNFADLRIEPYLKIPVSEIGIGSLPLLSTGLQVGVTKKF